MHVINEVVEYFVRAEHSFTFVEKHDFTASTAKRDIMKSYKFYEEKLKSILHAHSGRFCLTSDLWTLRNKLGFLSLTIHYIDSNWNLNKRVISFKMLESPHTEYNIANFITKELQYWGITDKIFSITLDNVTNNDTAEMFLKEKLSLSLHGILFQIRCCAHILNIIVQDGLSNLSSPIEKIKDIVHNINNSQARYELYIKCYIDVPHRWNSTYLLSDSTIKYKDVLNLYYSHLSQNSRCPLEKIEEHDWMLEKLVRDFLKVFDDSTKFFCGVYYPTSCRVIIQLINIYAKYSKFYGQSFGIFDEINVRFNETKI
ncbi:hypothetical protein ACB092_07G165400 [Castanea dentata]